MDAPEDTTDVQIGEHLSEQELCPDRLLDGQEAAFARDIARLQRRRGEFVSVLCPACGADDGTYIFTKFTFTYDRCGGCGTIYMTPRPSPEVMNDYYSNSENYAYWAEHIFPASEDSRREKIHKPWLQRIIELCERFEVPTGTLVEVGPGFGTFASVATESGRFDEVIAIETTPEMAQACRDRGVEVIESRVEDVDAHDLKADVIVSFEVIEHLFDPTEFLAQCQRLLQPGGMLVLTNPNGEGFDIAVLGGESLAVDPEHVNLFNPGSMRQMLDRFGFEVLDISTPGRLDAEFVREAILKGEYDVSEQPFLKRVLIDEWDELGWPFQQFLGGNGLSAHMWTAARKRAEA